MAKHWQFIVYRKFPQILTMNYGFNFFQNKILCSFKIYKLVSVNQWNNDILTYNKSQFIRCMLHSLATKFSWRIVQKVFMNIIITNFIPPRPHVKSEMDLKINSIQNNVMHYKRKETVHKEEYLQDRYVEYI